MSAPEKHQTARDTIGFGGGFGFLAGMFLPVGLMHVGVDLHLEDLPLALAVLIFVGSPFVVWSFALLLFTAGVKVLGRPAMAYVYTGLLLITFAVAGWVAGYFLTDKSVVAGVFGAVCLVLPNFFLLYSKREYLYGDEADTDQQFDGPDHSSTSDEKE